jgi:outer membrane protein OmpU
MNNLKKLGLTALAGSLAAVSAQAGEMSVSGSFNATYSTQDGNVGALNDTYDVSGATPSHGMGIGNDKDVTFSGSGELDNGFTFSGYTLMKDSFDVSSSSLTLSMGSLGSISTGSQTGGNSTKYDVQTPKAYEEVDDGGALSLSANYVGSWADNNSLIYASPSFDLGGDFSAVVHLEYSPEASGSSPNDGGIQQNTTWDSGHSLGVTLSGMGLTVGMYGAERESSSPKTDETKTRDTFEGVYYVNYSMGPVSVGYSKSYYDAGINAADTAKTDKKYVSAASGIFEAETMSIAFNVNDNLSISYASAEDTYDDQSNTKGGTEVVDVSMDMKSIQAAYSMGAMSIKAYRTETDNAAYSTLGGSLTVNEVALGLSF